MSYTVTIQDSNTTFTVEEGETVLDAALRQGISLAYGCRNGSCGACVGKVLEGEGVYPGATPEAVENGAIAKNQSLFCSLHPRSDLIIEANVVSAEEPLQIKNLPARVEALERLNHDVILMKLKLPQSERMQFQAGQYIEFLLEDGKRRAFSIANAPHDDEFITLHVREVEGGFFTHQIFHDMKNRTMLRIEGPHGSFYLRQDSANPIIMMAGGTGFGPCKGLIEHAIEVGVDRPIELYWGVRSKEDLYMKELAEKWAVEHENISFIPVLSEPQEGDNWSGETGWVHDCVASQHDDLSSYDVYMCGPPPMIDAGKKAFMAKGLTEAQMFSDSFEFSKTK